LGYHYTYKLLAPHAGLNLEGILTFLLALLLSLIAAALGMLLGTSLAVPLSGPTLERIAAAMRVHLGLPAPPGARTPRLYPEPGGYSAYLARRSIWSRASDSAGSAGPVCDTRDSAP
jgi:hypothetical protein